VENEPDKVRGFENEKTRVRVSEKKDKTRGFLIIKKTTL